MTSAERAKNLAKLLRRDLAAAGIDIPHSLGLELVAHQQGARDWNTLAASGRPSSAPEVGAASGPDVNAGSAPASRPEVASAGQPDAAPAGRPAVGPGVPVLRVMSVETALPFYVDYLGFRLDWTHRFEPGLPAYVQVSRSAAVLHLSEHHGDGSPNGVVWLPVADVYRLHRELLARPDVPMRPGVDADAPGGPTLAVIDPYGNVLRFAQPAQPAQPA
ncbi:glyoxalase superfamily protein [Plantactinospora sp. GCM10030261]|uniref:glyoxalase superfamily protein n=1 Tax=Plantactinospora sp. GCM10030261 TaxID=3273420 RepID=UPI003607B247